MVKNVVDHPWGLKYLPSFKLTQKKFPISHQMIYPLLEKCTNEACRDLEEVISKIWFSFFQNSLLFHCILSTYICRTLHLTKNVWWFVAFVEKIVSSLVRLWSSFLRWEILIFQTLLKISQDAFWTECVCSVGPLFSPVTLLYFYSEPWRQVGWNWKWGKGGGRRQERKKSHLL